MRKEEEKKKCNFETIVHARKVTPFVLTDNRKQLRNLKNNRNFRKSDFLFLLLAR